MKKIFKGLLFPLLFISASAFSQTGSGVMSIEDLKQEQFKISTRSYGPILGVQRGMYTYVEVGLEHHWRKVKLKNPKIYSLGGNFEYNFGHNLLGYKVNFWTKQNRVDLTYGLSFLFLTDFEQERIGVSPNLGFRLLGFHILTGYNFTIGSDKLEEYNTLYIALRYFIPAQNKIKFKKKNK